MKARKRICIVVPGYISSTPRAVREATALSGAGYDVHVTFTQGQLESLRAFDADLLSRQTWSWSSVGWSSQRSGERLRYQWSRLRYRSAQALPVASWIVPGILERAIGRTYPELAALATRTRADLYIGHYPDGLAAAHTAARLHGAFLGYDVEDLYAEIHPDLKEYAAEKDRIVAIERRYVPGCAHVSAVSQPVAAEFAKRYESIPVVVHNCDEWIERAHLDGKHLQRVDDAMSMYWFSQTVGLNRGLQDAIRAAARLSRPTAIHIQGSTSGEVRDVLLGVAHQAGGPVTLHFHQSAPPRELLSRACEHDVGLALEIDESMSRRLSVTNKLFLYLLAGLATAASDLPGQRSVLETCPGAGRLYRPGDVDSLARILDTWSRDPGQLAATKAAALEAARTRWNWELEQRSLVQSIDRLFEQAAAPAVMAW